MSPEGLRDSSWNGEVPRGHAKEQRFAVWHEHCFCVRAMHSEVALTSASESWSLAALHRRLAASHAARLGPRLDDVARDERAWRQSIDEEVSVLELERAFVENERGAIAEQVRRVPTDPDGFVRWFEGLKDSGPGQGDELFPWLATDASLEQMRWFLAQEVAGEAGFEDLVALAQLKLPPQAKLEMARNYWDEMGQGHEGGMHGPLLGALKRALSLDCSAPVWEALALGNLMVALAASRHYQYQAIGALGVIELTAPGRAERVNAGLKRLGVAGEARRYFALHATLDIRHSETWIREVFRPLVVADPRIAPRLAEGALLRLRAGQRCFARYRRELWGRPSTPQLDLLDIPTAAE
jgi:hypothetical protein